MFYTLQEELLLNFKCLSLTNSLETAYGPDSTTETLYQEESIGESLHLTRNKSIYVETPYEQARNLVLRKCGQEKPLPFEECYPSTILQRCRKIGEGVYGEVFLYKNSDGFGTVMKIIPIEGSQLVNDEPQKKFHEILSEIVIAMELSNLRYNKKNSTTGFSELKTVKCVQGRYPERLLDLWDLYDETHNSENDSPQMFGDNQLYIILELANGGIDMETFEFQNASESLYLFKQIACSLAVAENACEFEHRDLHWGNVLISKSDNDKLLRYTLNGREFFIPSNGIEASIIDFTLSRVKVENAVIYNDISKDPDLFNATGEYQFEIYKLMQKKNNNEWEHYEPYTNVLWLHYVTNQMIYAVRYAKSSTKNHNASLRKLIKLNNNILKYQNVAELINNEFLKE
uniref:non-specific serine/threonine protein kinase n=1 Tax=Photinus pyralis TaxID=7054 RepID=A0A1Y1MDJ0_PHOPY